MTTTLETSAIEETPTEVPDAPLAEAAESNAPAPPRAPTLLDLIAQAEREQPDPRAVLLKDLVAILDRFWTNRPRADDAQYLLAICDELHLPRETVRAGVEAIDVWRQQVRDAQASVGKLETRQAELSAQIEDLEAKRQALELDDGYAKLHAMAVAGVAHMLQKRAPNLEGGMLNYFGAVSDQFGFNKPGSYSNHPMRQAARREYVQLLRGETARQIIADLARRNVARGGVADGCSTEQLHVDDL